jgi:hypothetical protein
MKEERKHLTLSEMHKLDVKKVMDNIDYLDAIVDSCDDRSVLEMWRSRNGLGLLSDKERITLAQFVTTNKRLEEIGNKFNNKCKCNRQSKQS